MIPDHSRHNRRSLAVEEIQNLVFASGDILGDLKPKLRNLGETFVRIKKVGIIGEELGLMLKIFCPCLCFSRWWNNQHFFTRQDISRYELVSRMQHVSEIPGRLRPTYVARLDKEAHEVTCVAKIFPFQDILSLRLDDFHRKLHLQVSHRLWLAPT